MERSPTTDAFSRPELDRLRSLARRLVPEHDADDLAHDAWIASRDTEHDDNPSWWRTVLRRRRAMGARAEGRRRVRETRVGPSPPDALDPAAALERRRLVEALSEALAHLSTSEQELVVRRYCEGITAQELSAELGLPASTVRTRLSRSLARLRTHLDRAHGDRTAWTAAALAWTPSAPGPTPLLPPGTLAMTTTTKTVTAIGLGGLIAAATTWACIDDAPSTVSPDERPGTIAAANAGRTSRSLSPGSEDAANARRRWDEVRTKLLTRRKRAKPGGPAGVISDDALEAALTDVDQQLAQLQALGPVVSGFLETAVPLFVECLQLLPETATGKLHLTATVIGEPEVGTIVESVEVVDDSLDQPEFEECLRESAYATALDDVPTSLTKVLNIELDMEDRSLNVGTQMDLDWFAALPKADPALWAEMAADPEAQAMFPKLLEQPEIAAQYPELVAAIEAALAAADPG